MIKNISILCLLASMSGCGADVGGVIPPLPPCPSEAPQPDMALPDPCAGVSCPDGTCVNGVCVVPPDMADPCAGVTCGTGQICTNGTCACTDTSCGDGKVCTNGSCTDTPDMATPPDLTPPDPCAGVQCPADQVCTNGQCACTDTSCAAGSTCTNGLCVPNPDMSTPPDMTPVDPCANVVCAVGQICTNGTCACTDVSCPQGDICIQGGCVPPSCDYNVNCTFSYGYWKNHWVCNWQVVKLGTVNYNHTQLDTILQTPASGSNDLIELAHQLIGAKMNIVRGADPTNIQATVNAADALIGNLVIPSVGTGVLNSATAVSLAALLADYNLGNAGSPHCP